jgi:hypothetical protein
MKQLALCIFMMLSTLGIHAQSVERQGNTFIQVSNRNPTEKETMTSYVYKDSKGREYPVWLSSTGKAFVWKTSKKTGKEYKQYVPEIGKQINPQAYKDSKQKKES